MGIFKNLFSCSFHSGDDERDAQTKVYRDGQIVVNNNLKDDISSIGQDVKQLQQEIISLFNNKIGTTNELRRLEDKMNNHFSILTNKIDNVIMILNTRINNI